MLAKVEVTVEDNTYITNGIWWECITAKQFSWKMADDPILLLLSAINNKVCFIWVKFQLY